MTRGSAEVIERVHPSINVYRPDRGGMCRKAVEEAFSGKNEGLGFEVRHCGKREKKMVFSME
jgi:hypothetical protein